MTNPQGDFIWYELLTDDVEGAIAFYGEVIGWDVRSAGQDFVDYRLLSYAGTDVGGLMALPAEAAEHGMRPGWLGYVGVDDTDAAAADVAAAGGSVAIGPMDIPGVGRFAFVADPQGAPFYVMRGFSGGDSQAFHPNVAGHAVWNELRAIDGDAAFDFYAGRFGWTRGEAYEMGPVGRYQLFGPAGGDAIGGMMGGAGADRPAWRFYFGVDDIAAAQKRVEEAGGRVMHGPVAVPGGSMVLFATDPQGAGFGLASPPRQ